MTTMAIVAIRTLWAINNTIIGSATDVKLFLMYWRTSVARIGSWANLVES